MKKIIFYIDMLYRGGAQRVMANLVNYFAEQEYDIILINDFPKESDKEEYPVSEAVRRLYLRNDLSGNKIIKNISRILRLREIICLEKPDIVLSFLGRPNFRLLIATIGLKVKKVVSVRNDPNREYGASTWKKIFFGELFKMADGCVFQTADASKYFPKTVQGKSIIIFNPVGEQFFETNRFETGKNIITCGRLEKQKNQSLLIQAFAKIKDKYPEEKIVIYGNGALEKELMECAAQLGLNGRVEFPGNVEDVPGVLAKARLFVLSSDYEGMPNALMEAMTVGLPCISTDCPCGGPKDLIEDGKSGVLVPVGQVEDLAKAMDRVLADRDFAKILGNGAKRKSQEFETDKILKQWENYLNSIADKAH